MPVVGAAAVPTGVVRGAATGRAGLPGRGGVVSGVCAKAPVSINKTTERRAPARKGRATERRGRRSTALYLTLTSAMVNGPGRWRDVRKARRARLLPFRFE